MIIYSSFVACFAQALAVPDPAPMPQPNDLHPIRFHSSILPPSILGHLLCFFDTDTWQDVTVRMEGQGYILEHQAVRDERRGQSQDLELRVAHATFQGHQKLSVLLRLGRALGVLR